MEQEISCSMERFLGSAVFFTRNIEKEMVMGRKIE